MSFVAGYIDENIHYCPYCAERLDYISLMGETKCSHCGKSFCVIEGEESEDDSDEEADE